MDAGYQATARDLFDDFDEDELHSFIAGIDRVLDRIRGAELRQD